MPSLTRMFPMDDDQLCEIAVKDQADSWIDKKALLPVARPISFPLPSTSPGECYLVPTVCHSRNESDEQNHDHVEPQDLGCVGFLFSVHAGTVLMLSFL